MTQVTLGSEKKKKKKKKIHRGACLGPPLGAYAFDARFGKRSVLILSYIRAWAGCFCVGRSRGE